MIIDLLTNLGFILSLKPKFLALTLLCWGNCLADLSASLAMTKKGFGEMAITGSVASAIFCILVGLGLSTLIPLLKLKDGKVNWSAFGEHGNAFDLNSILPITLIVSLLLS